LREISIDCFCGGGGASLGYEMATGMQISIAINHDINAILMHQANHPDTLHLKEDIFKADLRKYLKDKKIAVIGGLFICWQRVKCDSMKELNQYLND
jgi:DNA (cytosine-5)-methyltransferase 1